MVQTLLLMEAHQHSQMYQLEVMEKGQVTGRRTRPDQTTGSRKLLQGRRPSAETVSPASIPGGGV